jgi:hypothetical protein
MSKPQPVPKQLVCDLCDLPWEGHGDKPTKDDCIRLLKAELRKRPSYTVTNLSPSSTIAQTTGNISWVTPEAWNKPTNKPFGDDGDNGDTGMGIPA